MHRFEIAYNIDDLENEFEDKSVENIEKQVTIDFAVKFFNQLKTNLNFKLEKKMVKDKNNKEINAYSLSMLLPPSTRTKKHSQVIFTKNAKHTFSTPKTPAEDIKQDKK